MDMDYMMIECELESIKRSKEENVKIYLENEKYISNHLENDTNRSIDESKIYDYSPTLRSINQKSLSNVKIVKTTSLIAAMSYENATILNFASGTRVGGGYTTGSNAQEECLCRSSNLYNVLKVKTNFYEFNRNLKSNLSSDLMIYSPSIIFFRDDYGNLMKDHKSFNIITAAAPNCRTDKYSNDVIESIFLRRIEKIFGIALANKNKNIILGAWGCGAFKCDPAIVANSFKTIIECYGSHFDNIVFAIVDSRSEQLISIFRNILKG